METLGNYKIIYRERTDEGSYVCTRTDVPGKEFLVVTTERSDCLQYLVPYAARNKTEDFIEDFSQDGMYCMVFTYARGKALCELPQDEKSRYIKPLLELLIQKNLPPEYMVAILSEDRILVDSLNRLHIVYTPPVVTMPVTAEDVFTSLSRLLQKLWPAPPDEDGLCWLQNLKNADSLCAAYLCMPPPAAAVQPEESPVDKLRALKERIPAAIAAALALAALLMAAYIYITTKPEAPPPGEIRSLGSVVITDE